MQGSGEATRMEFSDERKLSRCLCTKFRTTLGFVSLLSGRAADVIPEERLPEFLKRMT